MNEGFSGLIRQIRPMIWTATTEGIAYVLEVNFLLVYNFQCELHPLVRPLT